MEDISNGMRIFRVLKRVGHLLKQNMEKYFSDMKLTGPQGMLMGILAHDGEMKISDLSEKLGLSNSTVSGIIDRLEKQGLVERIRSKEDRRVVYVNVTAEYSRSAKDQFSRIEKHFEDVIDKATAEEVEIILKGLDTLEKLMERQQESNIN